MGHKYTKTQNTYSHPDGKTQPSSSVELHHQIDVDEQTNNWKKGQQGDLQEEGEG